MIQAHFPELVHLERADAGATAASRFEAVERGWVEITRPWHLLTTNSGAGDPRPATAEKGPSSPRSSSSGSRVPRRTGREPDRRRFPFRAEEVAR